MASSGRGDHPLLATFLRDASGLNRSALDALGKRSLRQSNPGDLATIYGDFFFGASGVSVPLTLTFAGTSSASLALTMGLSRPLTLTMAGVAAMALTMTVTTPPAGTPRTPTSFVAYCDLVASRDRIVLATIDDIIQQHTFLLDKEDLILSEFFPSVSTTSGALVTVLKSSVRVKDYAGSPALASSWVWTAYAWASAGVTGFEVRLADNPYGSSSTVTVTTSLTTGLWRAFGTLTPRFGNDADEIELQARISGGAGTVYVGGLGIFAP